MSTVQDYQTGIQPTWCPGCGAYTLRVALIQALTEMGKEPHEVAITYDIGCNGNGADKIKSYAFKSLHGRSLPPAIGVKYANSDLTVIATIGDGGLFWEGAAHWISTMQRNEDILCIVFDNQIYGLTTGQASPTTPEEQKTVSTPRGNPDKPINPIAVSLASNATFVARGWVGDVPQLKELIKEGIKHKGFAILDVMMQCVTWTKMNMMQYYKDMVYGLEFSEEEAKIDKSTDKIEAGDTLFHDPQDKQKAMELALKEDKLATGVFYQVEEDTMYEKYEPLQDKTPLVKQEINANVEDLMMEFE